MSRPANIYELLEDENDETRQVATVKKDAKKVATKPAPKTDAKANTRAPQRKENEVSEKKANRPPRQRDSNLDRRDKERKEKVAQESGVPPRQRVFDRRSGTGRGRETKKSGAGSANWGTVDDDKQAQLEPVAEKTEETPVAESKPVDTTATEVPVEEKKEEEEEPDNTKTLDEYLKAKKSPAIPLPERRQAAPADWTDLVQLKRSEEVAEKKKDESKKKEETTAAKKQTISADQVIKFEGKPVGRRGGRGGARGGSRGSPRTRGGPSRSTQAPKINEENFPSLATAIKA